MCKTKSAYSTRSDTRGTLNYKRSLTKDCTRWGRKELTVEVGGIALQPPAFMVEAGFSAATTAVEFPASAGVPASAVACDRTTQLPNPAPEMNCYESGLSQSIDSTASIETTYCQTQVTCLSSSTFRARREGGDHHCRFSSRRWLAQEIKS